LAKIRQKTKGYSQAKFYREATDLYKEVSSSWVFVIVFFIHVGNLLGFSFIKNIKKPKCNVSGNLLVQINSALAQGDRSVLRNLVTDKVLTVSLPSYSLFAKMVASLNCLPLFLSKILNKCEGG
jgi:hypothetical protein